jgi:hypothetical protein
MGLLAGLIVCLTIFVGSPAHAILVGTTPGTVPLTSGVNPASCSSTPGCGTWTQGDPGWANEIHLGYTAFNGDTWYTANGVYIGDGWVLTANHVGMPVSVQFDSGATFNPIPNQNFQVANPVPNPTNDPHLTGPVADLRMFRINGESGVAALPLPTQGLNQNDQVVMMSFGVLRASALSSFLVNKLTNPWTWTSTPTCTGPNCFQGFNASGQGKAWGTNRIANSDNVLGENDGNLQTIVNNSTIAYLTTYDQSTGDPFEALNVGGDSGSGVFYKRNGQWQLAGITLAKYTFSGQDSIDPNNQMAIFGNANAFADLSSYNAPGNSPIMNIINAHQDYSLVGDINLDGVSGAADDLSAFVAGWRYNNGTGAGTITSWLHGDVTHDGKTDVADFLRMRSSLNAGAGAELTALMNGYISDGSGNIPEPSTIMLVVGPAILFTLRGRNRRPRLTA